MTQWKVLHVPAPGFEHVRCALVPPLTQIRTPLRSHWLSRRERTAGDEMHSDRRRADWLAGRLAAKVAMRELLGGDLELSQLTITYAPRGRPVPVCEGRVAEHGFWLAISHSRGAGLAAAAPGVLPIGVDIEHAAAPLDGLADYMLGAEDRARWPTDAPPSALRACWTLKEAALKALGVGLRIHPRHVEIETNYSLPCAPALWKITGGGVTGAGRGWFSHNDELTWAIAILGLT